MASDGGWGYRLVRRVVEGKDTFAVHEAFYDAEGRVWSVTEEPIAPCGETRDEALADLATMLADALRASVLDFDTIPEPGAVHPLDVAPPSVAEGSPA